MANGTTYKCPVKGCIATIFIGSEFTGFESGKIWQCPRHGKMVVVTQDKEYLG